MQKGVKMIKKEDSSEKSPAVKEASSENKPTYPAYKSGLEAAAQRIRVIADTSNASTLRIGLSMVKTAGLQHGLLGLQIIDPSISRMTYPKIDELNNKIEELQRDLDLKAAELEKKQINESDRIRIIKEYEVKVKTLTEYSQFGFLLTRVNEQAKALLLNSEEFRKNFLTTEKCNVYVMSVDIRRSTQLMLNARTPQQFADFITTLCRELEEVVKENYGVFDKFTGDGILAFFPDFFSGEDAGYNVVSAAIKCHQIFKDKYNEYRKSFTPVIQSTGLGIGIDYGPAHLVQIAGGLTVVGSPVVYSCRLGGAPKGATLLNQPAYEKISERFSEYCFFTETTLDIKNEGPILAYEVILNKKKYQSKQPTWVDTLSSMSETQHKK